MYTLILNVNGAAITKSINYLCNLTSNEIEITEEQYDVINEFLLKLTIECLN